MDSPMYLIIITLVEGQNFTVPDGAPDRLDATVFAEARFGNESILRSDPIKLVNSNPEFVTELAWQLDKRSLHQLRVERRAIKLQVFMQTCPKKRAPKSTLNNNDHHQAAIATRGQQMDINQASANHDTQSSPTNNIELIGYTVIDIRTAQESEQPKYQWLPLLNPKFRKSSYNRPEIQLSLSLNRIDENAPVKSNGQATELKPHQAANDSDSDFSSLTNNLTGYQDMTSMDPSDQSSSRLVNGYGGDNFSSEARTSPLYKTCLNNIETIQHSTIESNAKTSHEQDEIIENDLQIRHIDNNHYIYDTKDPKKSTIDDCKERYKVAIVIPFHSDLDLLMKITTNPTDAKECYYFSVNLFGSTLRSNQFEKLTTVETNELQFNVMTTDYSVLATYFSLNSCLVIKLHQSSGATIGLATVQLDQLCSLIGRSRSIEGIFALEPINPDSSNESKGKIHPSLGVSVSLERINEASGNQESQDNSDLAFEVTNGHKQEARGVQDALFREHFGNDIETILTKSMDDVHSRTFDIGNSTAYFDPAETFQPSTGHDLVDQNGPNHLVDQTGISIQDEEEEDEAEQDHHFCFTIDLKNFSYTQDQRLIPTLRELVVRYSYQFFGYKDTITTDASIPISPTNSIIVSGFCEFNFATSYESLLTALKELPLNLDILTCEQMQPKNLNLLTTTGPNQSERVVATCNLNLAEILGLTETSLRDLKKSVSNTFSAPIYDLNAEENGQLLVYLSLKDLGLPAYALSADKLAPKVLNGEPNRANATSNGLDKHDATLVRSRAITTGLEDSTRGASPQLVGDSEFGIGKIDAFIEEAKTSIELWKDKYVAQLFEETRARENERLKRIQQRSEAREAKREHEFKRRLEDLGELERRHSKALDRLESFEQVLTSSFEQLKSKDALLDSRLNMLDLKLSKAINDIRLESDRHHSQRSLATYPKKLARSTDDNCLDDHRLRTTTTTTQFSSNLQAAPLRPANPPVIQSRILAKPVKSNIEVSQLRRSSVRSSLPKNMTSIPVRSASLVTRGTTESSTVAAKRTLVARPVRIQSTVINEMLQSQTNRPTAAATTAMSRPSRLNLPKEIQDKIASLRREKAELLRRGRKPSDGMIQEINSLIERLVS